MRSCCSTTSDPRFSRAMVRTASVAWPEGSMLMRRLPLTLRISLTSMVDLPLVTCGLGRILFSTMAQKTVLVTGGARGIGRGTALLLAQRGYRVAVADLERGGELPFFRCDVSREPSVRSCVRAVVKRFGGLDALINNAGLADPADAPIDKLPLKHWQKRIAVNLTGVFLMTKHCTPHLR